MIALKMQQGTPEWLEARLGMPTASNFHRIITPTGAPSSQATGYMNALLAERLIGAPCMSDELTQWMERGIKLENEARRWYEFRNGLDVQRVGFCVTDSQHAGASPDSLVGEDGLLEIKVPRASTHVGYLRERIATAYRPQLQGQLWVTGRKWVDFVSYCPGMPAGLKAVQVRVVRDGEFIAKLGSAVDEFCARLEEANDLLLGRGGEQARSGALPPKESAGSAGTTEAAPGQDAPPADEAPDPEATYFSRAAAGGKGAALLIAEMATPHIENAIKALEMQTRAGLASENQRPDALAQLRAHLAARRGGRT